MMKTQIGLGVLAIPSALDVLGMVPGIICLLAMAVITTWSGYVIGTFKLRHREVYSIDDAGGVMFGLTGRAILSTGFCLCMCTHQLVLLKGPFRLHLLTTLRLCLQQCFRNPQSLNWPECNFYTCHMYCCVCCCGCDSRMCYG